MDLESTLKHVALFNRVASHAGNDCEFETRSTGKHIGV